MYVQYPKMHAKQRAVLLPGGFASTSGPRGGAHQFSLNCSACPGPDCTIALFMSCTSDPFSCANLQLTPAAGGGLNPDEGLRWQVNSLLTKIGGRPCWNLSQYDQFNSPQAQMYYAWAASDTRVVAIVVWPWGGVQGSSCPECNTYMPSHRYPGCNVALGSATQPVATAAWAAVGRKIRAAAAVADVANAETEANSIPPQLQ